MCKFPENGFRLYKVSVIMKVASKPLGRSMSMVYLDYISMESVSVKCRLQTADCKLGVKCRLNTADQG